MSGTVTYLDVKGWDGWVSIRLKSQGVGSGGTPKCVLARFSVSDESGLVSGHGGAGLRPSCASLFRF